MVPEAPSSSTRDSSADPLRKASRDQARPQGSKLTPLGTRGANVASSGETRRALNRRRTPTVRVRLAILTREGSFGIRGDLRTAVSGDLLEQRGRFATLGRQIVKELHDPRVMNRDLPDPSAPRRARAESPRYGRAAEPGRTRAPPTARCVPHEDSSARGSRHGRPRPRTPERSVGRSDPSDQSPGMELVRGQYRSRAAGRFGLPQARWNRAWQWCFIE